MRELSTWSRLCASECVVQVVPYRLPILSDSLPDIIWGSPGRSKHALHIQHLCRLPNGSRGELPRRTCFPEQPKLPLEDRHRFHPTRRVVDLSILWLRSLQGATGPIHEQTELGLTRRHTANSALAPGVLAMVVAPRVLVKVGLEPLGRDGVIDAP